MANNEFLIPSIAARKAARKKTLAGDMSTQTQSSAVVAAPVIEAPQAMPEAFNAITDEGSTIQPTAPRPISTNNQELSKEMLLKLASQFGLKLQPEKKEFIKHTYSITPERKEKMKAMSDALGMNLQDAICEAFDLFFARHAPEFEAVTKAKKGN